MKRGCPRGSSFGPLLWNMFQNDLSLHVEGGNMTMYADDHQLHGKGTNYEIVSNWKQAASRLRYGTNVNHKGLQRTANKYVEEPRIYKDLISENNNVDILNSASRILQCWSYYVKLTLQDVNTTPKELKTERDCSHRVVQQPEKALMKNIRALWF